MNRNLATVCTLSNGVRIDRMDTRFGTVEFFAVSPADGLCFFWSDSLEETTSWGLRHDPKGIRKLVTY